MIEFFKNLWHKYQIYKESKRIDQEIDAVFGHNRFTINTEIVQDQTQRQYFEALIQIKKKVKEVANGNIKDFLATNPDLLNFANKDKDEVIDILNKITIASGKDVKTEEDKAKMIDKRIGHYHQLQQYNEEKELVRKIRQAMKSGNSVLHDELMKEWRKKYGNRNGSNSKPQN